LREGGRVGSEMASRSRTAAVPMALRMHTSVNLSQKYTKRGFMGDSRKYNRTGEVKST
jgi:hypothetical protein